ncbi:O-antigen ligase family protein [Polaribacter pectinis]|uniref:O-antigen ligase family protein n=1 Tax=Polaribacter pectinis TaxID=2738844 RepID=A0A7G9L988_9FLAO|nr:O-antigen ligase family protein [Polaribacter pectinis]QNM85187.1 O-antigen ligase family protein [Polaribacter pectinis]
MSVFQKIKQFNIYEALVALLLITLPLGFAVNSIAVILFSLTAIYFVVFKRVKSDLTILSILLFLFFILCLLSLFWTDNVENTQEGLSRFLSFLILPLAFSIKNHFNIKKEKVFNVFSKSLVVYAAYSLIVGLVKAVNNKDIGYLFYHKLSGNLSNMNAIYLSVFMSFGIAFFLNKKVKSKLDIFCLIFLSLFLVLLSSKIIITITLLSSIIFFFKKFDFRKIKLKQIVVTVSIILLFLIASFNYVDRIKTELQKTKISEVLNKKDFGHVYLWTGTGLRVFQIKAFTEILSEQKKYFLGEGLNNSQQSLNEKYKEYNFYPGFLNYNYHNQYIQVMAELGGVGLLIILLIFFFIGKQAIFYKDYFLLTFIFLILVVCITESFFWRQRGMVFFITVLLLFNKRKNTAFE